MNFYEIKTTIPEITNEITNFKKIIIREFGAYNEETIRKFAEEFKMSEALVIKLAEEDMMLNMFLKEIAIRENVSTDYLLGLTEKQEPYPFKEEI